MRHDWAPVVGRRTYGGIPGERHVAPRADGIGAVAVPVGCDHGQLAALLVSTTYWIETPR